MALTRRLAIVSGSNKGIGLAIVKKLCGQFDGDVLLTARSEEKGKEAVKALEAEGLNPKFHQLDIDSTTSIEELRNFTMDTYKGLDVLVNNAGIFPRDASTAGVERATITMRTNFTGTLNMHRAFAPMIRPHGRIVNVAAQLGMFSQLSSESLCDKLSSPDLKEEELVALMDQYIEDMREGKHGERGWAKTPYSNSKMAVLALTSVYAQKFASSGVEDVLVNACCPGWVKTDMGGPKAPLTPDQGAETPVLCALLPPGSPTGKFWKNKAVHSPM